MNRTLLVVDHDGNVRESLSEVLGDAGYRIHLASLVSSSWTVPRPFGE